MLDNLGNYSILKDSSSVPISLGSGEWGDVCKAFNRKLRCYAALRVIPHEFFPDAASRDKFVRDVRIATHILGQRRLAAVFPLESVEGNYLYGTEICDGEKLTDRMARDECLSPQTALIVGSQMATALDTICEAGLLHQRITARNIILDDDSDSVKVKILDLALPQTTSPKGPAETAFDCDFRSPEETAGLGVDTKSAIYTLGAVFYYMLEGPEKYQLLRQKSLSGTDNLLDGATHLDAGSTAILKRTLPGDPASRIQTFAELRALIDRAIESPETFAEEQAREVAEKEAQEAAERLAQENAERQAREAAERQAREDAERKIREDLETQARQEAEKQAREDTERKIREDLETQAREEAARQAREDTERRAREELETRARADAEKQARENAEKRAREDAERRARENAKRQAEIGAEKRAREEETERQAEIEAEKEAREEAEKQASEDLEPGPAITELAAEVEATSEEAEPIPVPSILGQEPKKGVPAWVWFVGMAVFLIAALAFIFLQSGPSRKEPPSEPGNLAQITNAETVTPPVPPPSLAFGDLLVQSDPPGAGISLDGGAPQKAPYTFANVAFGRHQLIATLNGYQQSVQYAVVSDKTTNFPLRLEAVAASGDFTVESDPPGALISIDHGLSQRAPFTFKGLSFGSHPLTATRDGYQTQNEEVQFYKTSTYRIKLLLTPNPAQNLIDAIKADPHDSPDYINAAVSYLQYLQNHPTAKGLDPEKLRGDLTSALQALQIKQVSLKPSESKKFCEPYMLAIRNAAQLDFLPAILLLAYYLDSADPKTAYQAFQWYYYAAVTKKDPFAMMKLARSYLAGSGSVSDDQKKQQAFYWFQAASNAGNKTASAYLSQCYLLGVGCTKDSARAIETLKQLSADGVGTAENILGAYDFVQVDGSDDKYQLQQTALSLLKRAVSHGEPSGNNGLGRMYEKGLVDENGKQLAPDLDQAKIYYQAGVEQEVPLCQFNLGLLLYGESANPPGNPTLEHQAVELIAQAAKAGNSKAQAWIDVHPANVRDLGTTP